MKKSKVDLPFDDLFGDLMEPEEKELDPRLYRKPGEPVVMDYYQQRSWYLEHGLNPDNPAFKLNERIINPYSEMQQQALIASGGRVWQKSRYHRLYLNPCFIGLQQDQNGNWTLKGKTNDEAKELKRQLWYAYIDLDERKIYEAKGELLRRIKKVVNDVLRQYPDAKTA